MWKILAGIVAVAAVSFLVIQRYRDPTVDVRTSIDRGVAEVKKSTSLDADQERVLRLQLALNDYRASNGNFPERLDMLVPKYFDAVPTNPLTGGPYEYAVEGDSFRLGAQVTSRGGSQVASLSGLSSGDLKASLDLKDFVNPNTMAEDPFVYDPTGKRDPFEPFDLSQKNAVDESAPPLERYELGQLRVTAILQDTLGGGDTKAIVEDQQGKGYTVSKGTRIGNQNGVVVSIEADRVNVLEVITDFTGQVERRPVVMKLVNPADAKRKELKGAKKGKK